MAAPAGEIARPSRGQLLMQPTSQIEQQQTAPQQQGGGMVTNLSGSAFDLYGEETLASNGRIHAAMQAVVAERLARARIS